MAYMLCAYPVPGTVLRGPHVLSQLILITAPPDNYYYQPHCTEDKTEVQGD